MIAHNFGDVMGVMFGDKHSFRDYGMWLRERPHVGTPEPKIDYVEIPGADGVLDVTEAVTGEVKYGERDMLFRFSVQANIAEQQNIKMRLRNDLHGKRMHIVLDEDSDYYYDGRVNVEFVDEMPWKFGVDISVMADPFKYELEETELHFDLSDFSSIEFSPVENTSKQEWNSLFVFGSANAPTGNWQIYNSVRIEWTANSRRRQNAYWQITDGDGHTENFTLPTEGSGTYVDVVYTSELQTSGINLEKVYRVLVSGIGDCKLVLTSLKAKQLIVGNGAKSVVPTWLVGDAGMYAVVNGITASLPTGYSKNPQLVLSFGENEVLVSNPTYETGQKTIDLTFRRGWL